MSCAESTLSCIARGSKLLIEWELLCPTEDDPLEARLEYTMGWKVISTSAYVALARSSHIGMNGGMAMTDFFAIPVSAILSIKMLDELGAPKASEAQLGSEYASKTMEDTQRDLSPLLNRWTKGDKLSDVVPEYKKDDTTSVERARRVSNMITTWEQEDREDDTKHADVVFDPKTPDTYPSPRADRIRLS